MFTACFLGWTLDAFDFFLLTYCLDSVASTFHVSNETATEALFWTLAMRPVGALLFGVLAERFGRRPTLMLNILCFSAFELSSAFAPTFTIFLVTRALFGVAMGGEWGVASALALETLPAENRGFFSGLLQEGYVMGNLLAALVYGVLFTHLHGHGVWENWRVLFMVGALPSLLVMYVRKGVQESPAWRAPVAGERGHGSSYATVFRQIAANWPLFLFLVVMMTAFTSFSHGTQDLYPLFLKHDHHLTPQTTSWVAIVGNIGGITGGVLCGALSQRFGRRRTIVVFALLAIPVIPLWAWSPTAALLALGGFLMQFMVQGAWGVIPAHLNELSPSAVRAIVPGLSYQLGNLFSSRNGHMQAHLANVLYAGRLQPVMGWTVVVVGIAVALATGLGRERRGAVLAGE